MPEWALSLDVVLLLPVTAAVLSLGGVQRASAVIDHWPMLSTCRGRSLAPLQVGRVIAAVASMYGTRCLTSAVVLQGVLRRLGVASELVIGAAGFGSQFRAHAWVERDGIVVPGQSAEGYKTIHRFARPATERCQSVVRGRPPSRPWRFGEPRRSSPDF